MFGWFSRRRQNPSPLPQRGADDSWAVAHGVHEGQPLIVRYRSSPPQGVAPSVYRHLLAITWTYEPRDASGMPPADVSERMQELEERLDAALEPCREAFLMVSTTCGGLKQWLWYSRNSEIALELLNAALGDLPPFPIEIGDDDDPTWEAYRGYQESAT